MGVKASIVFSAVLRFNSSQPESKEGLGHTSFHIIMGSGTCNLSWVDVPPVRSVRDMVVGLQR